MFLGTGNLILFCQVLIAEEVRCNLLLPSGINAGPNTGQSIHYSGTVGAAREANINGYPSIALSLSFPEKGVPARLAVLE